MSWPIAPGGPMSETSIVRCKAILFAGTVLMFLGGCSQEHSHMQMTGFTQADVKHGEYEAEVFGCQDCHTVRQPDGLHLDKQLILAGGVPMPGLEGSFTYSANVTISSQYPAQVLDDTIRGRLMYKFRMPTDLYNGMSSDDMRDLVAYLKTLRPILHRPLPDDRLPPGFVMPAPNPREPIPEHEPPVGTIERGSYVTKMFVCQECHSPRTAGGGYVQGQLFQGGGLQWPMPDGHLLIAPNITPDRETGIGAWSDDEIIRAVRTGVARDGRQLNPLMPYLTAYHDMTNQDAKDLVRFLRTVTPAKRTWPSSQ
jgi:mono/diheme cytochrome c family protein